MLVFKSWSSIAASTTSSRSARSAKSVVKERFWSAIPRASSESLPECVALSKEATILFCPLSTAPASISRTSTFTPERAQTSAIPEPINPQPTTPTFLISLSTMYFSLTSRLAMRQKKHNLIHQPHLDFWSNKRLHDDPRSKHQYAAAHEIS